MRKNFRPVFPQLNFASFFVTSKKFPKCATTFELTLAVEIVALIAAVGTVVGAMAVGAAVSASVGAVVVGTAVIVAVGAVAVGTADGRHGGWHGGRRGGRCG